MTQDTKQNQMSSRALPRLPTIDFSNINKQNRDTVLWDSTKNKVLQALQEFGCFEASLNGISPDLRNSVFASLKELFDLPLETKVKNFTEKFYNGYIGLAKEIPIYESMGIEDPESFSNLMWPNGNDEFSKCIQIYSHKLMELDEIVRTMVLESLNLEKYMDEHMELTSYLTRVMKYRVPQKDEPNAGLLSHADKTLVSILHENGVQGLEVQTKDGEWFKVKLSANTFVVMVGENFKVLTNGRLHPAVHKVVLRGDKDRYSIGVFSIPKDEKTLKAPEEMIDEDHPLLFKPFVYKEFFKFFLKEENVNDPLALEKFCGVTTENL